MTPGGDATAAKRAAETKERTVTPAGRGGGTAANAPLKGCRAARGGRAASRGVGVAQDRAGPQAEPRRVSVPHPSLASHLGIWPGSGSPWTLCSGRLGGGSAWPQGRRHALVGVSGGLVRGVEAGLGLRDEYEPLQMQKGTRAFAVLERCHGWA